MAAKRSDKQHEKDKKAQAVKEYKKGAGPSEEDCD